MALASVAVDRAPGQEPHTRQPTTTHAVEVLRSAKPRVLFVERGRSLEVELRNAGYLSWSRKKKFYLSYHWLSITGVETAEVGFRSRLPRDVLPGETVFVDATLNPPSRPGIYRLRWDMLQEEEIWFAELATNPPSSHWVLVLPALEFFFVVFFPALVLLLAFSLARRERHARLAPWLACCLAVADLAWVATALYGKPFLLYADLPKRFLHTHSWTSGAAVALLLLPLAALSLGGRRMRMARPWIGWLAVLIGAVDVWGQVLYYRFFGDVATTATFFAVRQTGSLAESVSTLAEPRDLYLAIDLLLALPLVFTLTRRERSLPRLFTPVLLVLLLLAAAPILKSLASALTTHETSTRRNLKALRTVSEHGLLGYQMLDLTARATQPLARRPLQSREFEEAVAWFRDTAPERAAVDPWAGKAEGANLIAIQVESMQQFVLGLEIEGQEITPNLNRLRETALEFTAVHDQTSRGRSSAGDFVTMTSILPVAESVAYEFWQNDYLGLGRVLSERGYGTFSAIPYKGSFWNRYLTHPAYGFETNLFREAFESDGTRIGWGINDLAFLRQAAPMLSDLEEPFVAWLTTLSLHYPYASFPANLKALRLGDLERTPLGNYFHAMNLFDRAVGEMFETLENEGLRKRSVIALWSDHDAGLMRQKQFVEYFELGSPAPKRHLFSRIPFLIWVPGAEGERVERMAGQTDITPTLLSLLGVDPARLAYLGRNLLGNPPSGPTIHSRGWSVDSERFYLASQVEIGKGSCWSLPRLALIRTSGCREQIRAAQRQLEISELLLEHDLQAEISARLAGAPVE